MLPTIQPFGPIAPRTWESSESGKKQNCDICEKPSAETSWLSHNAHIACLKQLGSAEDNLATIISKKNFDSRCSAHATAVKAVRASCGEKTILEYIRTEGEDKLTKLFNTVGLNAVQQLSF